MLSWICSTQGTEWRDSVSFVPVKPHFSESITWQLSQMNWPCLNYSRLWVWALLQFVKSLIVFLWWSFLNTPGPLSSWWLCVHQSPACQQKMWHYQSTHWDWINSSLFAGKVFHLVPLCMCHFLFLKAVFRSTTYKVSVFSAPWNKHCVYQTWSLWNPFWKQASPISLLLLGRAVKRTPDRAGRSAFLTLSPELHFSK